MADKINICINSNENARKFLDGKDKRKAPNNRVSDFHFMDIANVGAKKIKETMIKN